MRTIHDDERRRRVARRHALALTADDPVAAAESVVCLHATEPASVHLSSWARSGTSRNAVSRALDVDRTLIRVTAMRRTLFAVPRPLLAAVVGVTVARIGPAMQQRLVSAASQAGIGDADAWAQRPSARVAELLDERPRTAAELAELLPDLATRFARGSGRYRTEVALAREVLTALSAGGRIVRAAEDGPWWRSRPRWAGAATWSGAPLTPLDEQAGYARLVAGWLGRFGPGTEDDLVWWLGSTRSAVRAALAEVGATAVGLDGGSTGWVLPDDIGPAPDLGDWAALLPALDPTTMGWRDRTFYLGEHGSALVDRNGNAGPTAWWNGRVVGGWYQRDGGEVVVLPVGRLPRAARVALDAKAAELTAWFDGEVVRSIYQSPLVRDHLR